MAGGILQGRLQTMREIKNKAMWLQLVLDSRPHPHQAPAMQQQMPQVPFSHTGNTIEGKRSSSSKRRISRLSIAEFAIDMVPKWAAHFPE